MEAEDEIVGRIIEGDEPEMRLQGEARTGVEGGHLVEGERGVSALSKASTKAHSMRATSMARR